MLSLFSSLDNEISTSFNPWLVFGRLFFRLFLCLCVSDRGKGRSSYLRRLKRSQKVFYSLKSSASHFAFSSFRLTESSRPISSMSPIEILNRNFRSILQCYFLLLNTLFLLSACVSSKCLSTLVERFCLLKVLASALFVPLFLSAILK